MAGMPRLPLNEKLALLREYGVPASDALLVARLYTLSQIQYLCRRIERHMVPNDDVRDIAAYFADLFEAQRAFGSMRVQSRAAAWYTVGVRNETIARIQPRLADVVCSERNDLTAINPNFREELDFRLVELYHAVRKNGNATARERDLRERFAAFSRRLAGELAS